MAAEVLPARMLHPGKSGTDHAPPEATVFAAEQAQPAPELQQPDFVLVVTCSDADRRSLEAILTRAGIGVRSVGSVREAAVCLRRKPVPVVIADCRLNESCWKDLWAAIRNQPRRPCPRLIIASPAAEEHLWAEVIELGAHDVLLKPFDRNDVLWSVSDAWCAWKRESELCASVPKVKKAGA